MGSYYKHRVLFSVLAFPAHFPNRPISVGLAHSSFGQPAHSIPMMTKKNERMKERQKTVDVLLGERCHLLIPICVNCNVDDPQMAIAHHYLRL